jgi:toluene monooxygenase system protein E
MKHPGPPPLRTYSHLEGKSDVPSTYDIVSTRLLYYVGRGFSVNVPATAWYQRYQSESPLSCRDWEGFRDPRETTYTSYTQRAAQSESHLDAVAHSIDLSGHDATLAAAWLALAGDVVAPMRYVWHAFQMVSAYIGQMAPTGRITLVTLFQAGDEMRRVHRVAQRMGQLREANLTFGQEARVAWQEHRAWQPLRKAVEESLIAYDWGEAFVALCLGLKPLLDDFVLGEFAHQARARGDYSLGQILDSLALDGMWHRQWASALVALLLGEDEAAGEDPERHPERRTRNREALERWLARWRPAGLAAIEGLATLAPETGGPAVARSRERTATWLRGLGLSP